MKITKAQFVKSVSNYKDLYKSDYNEVAFVGRSNVGKSSLINFVCNNKKLAKTSSLPGRTRLVNYFLINDSFLLVDLPGYGYAKASKESQENWGELLGKYLTTSKNLKCVYLLLDARHLPSDKDKQMVHYLYYYKLPTVFVLTKCDKLTKSQINIQKQKIAHELALAPDNFIATSADNKYGLNEMLDSIEYRLSVDLTPKTCDEDESGEE